MLYDNTSSLNNSYGNDIKHAETYMSNNNSIYHIEEHLDLSGLNQLASTALYELQNLQRKDEMKMEAENAKETRSDEEMETSLKLESNNIVVSSTPPTSFGNRISIKDLLSPPSHDECTMTSVQLYCVCRSSDGQLFMIECDECDEWFHGTCVNITSEEATLIDKYYCPNCTAKGYKTSWKPEKCKNQECKKVARFAKSGFCSVRCGLAWNRKILEQEERLVKMESLLNKKKKSSTKKNQNVHIVMNRSEQMSDKECLRNIAKKKAAIKKELDIINKLNSIDNNDMDKTNNDSEYNNNNNNNNSNNSNDSKNDNDPYKFINQSKAGKISQNGQICGFTPKRDWIVDDDIDEYDDDDVVVEVCRTPRGRCKKHANWQNFRISQIQLMKSNKYENLARLNEQKRLIKQRMRKRAEIDEAFVNETIDHIV